MIKLPFLLGILLLSAGPAQAHPHVFLTAAAELDMKDGALRAIMQTWRFDLFFSQVLISDFDQNSSGTLEGIESDQMQDIVFGSSKDYGYFTWLTLDGETQDLGEAGEIEVSVDDGELVFAFTVPLATPADMTGKEAMLSLYDPTIYVDVYVPEDAISVVGMDEGGCSFGFSMGEELSTIDGFLTPQIIKLDCVS